VTQLLPGDVLLVEGTSVFDKLIRWATNSPYNHAAIVATDCVSVIEAQTPVALRIPASFYAGRADVWRPMPFAPNVALAASARAERFVGKPYGWAEVLGSGLWDVAHIPLRYKLRTFDCSGLVVQSYADVGLLITWHPFPAPGDIAFSAIVQNVGPL